MSSKISPYIYLPAWLSTSYAQAIRNIMAKNGISDDITPLQRELLLALVESGISKEALLNACYELYAIQAEESLESADGVIETDQQGDRPKHDSSNHQQITAGRSDAIKLEEASRRVMAQDARLATGRLEVQQMNFVDQMLRYVSVSQICPHEARLVSISLKIGRRS